MVETVNVNGDKWMIEKIRSCPHTITIPPSKTCTTRARLQSLQVSIIEDDTAAGVLKEGAVCDDMSRVVAEGAKVVWAIVGGVAKVVAKRTVVLNTTILGVTRGALMAAGALILQAVNMKMPCDMVVKTTSLSSHCGLQAQTGVSRCNSSGVGGGTALLKGGVRIGGIIQQGSGS